MTDATYMLRWSNGQQYGPATMTLLVQWAREGRVPTDAVLVPTDGSPTRAARDTPELAAIVTAPPTISTGLQMPSRAPVADDGPGPAIIPYKNPPALIGYYLAVFSLIPFLGLLLGVPAFICGIVGLRKRIKNPKVRGMAHALIAIILGGITSLVWAFVIVAAVHQANKGSGF